MQSYTAIECKLYSWAKEIVSSKQGGAGEGGGRGEAEDENKQHKENEIRTTMWSSVAMQQSCTSGPRQCFLSSE